MFVLSKQMDGQSDVKVFSIGFGRVASRSLNAYLRLLGYRAIHWPAVINGVDFKARLIPFIGNSAAAVDALAPVLAKYDAFGDVPFPGLYRELDIRYPNARFILLTRDLDAWFRSAADIWALQRGAHVFDPFERVLYNLYLPGKQEVTLDDKSLLIAAHQRHIIACQEHFGGRLLCIDISNPRLGASIAKFLGRTAWPFPHISDDAQPLWITLAVAARAAQGYLFKGWRAALPNTSHQ